MVQLASVSNVVRDNDGSTSIACRLCSNKKFNTMKGWRIHAARMHKECGYYQKCHHYLTVPFGYTKEQISAAMEMRCLEWCPAVSKAVMLERAAKKRKLELIGREIEAKRFFISSKWLTVLLRSGSVATLTMILR
ncbi:unnamed protein product [Thelazia callipaeda]|uniref:C2H2-type domain-containing protein n=1 Tax=Thelazia callipaeda TaxID=103827 RepID=A0A0N5DC15_THECL|nr:unnamed protein product [Thelazia callipaeda]